MQATELSKGGQTLVAQGEDPMAVRVAETLLGIFRSLRVLQLMQESGHDEWQGITADELGAFVAVESSELGIDPDDVEASGAMERFIGFRLQELRSMAYREYLRTPEWKDVRRFALWRANDRCQTCNAKAGLQVHHRTYDRRGCERLADVTVLCGDCHGSFHRTRSVAR